jgi:hypothetical protein
MRTTWTAVTGRRCCGDRPDPRSWISYASRGGVAGNPVRQVGGRTILELWVPAEELDEFNEHIAGLIEVVHEFR